MIRSLLFLFVALVGVAPALAQPGEWRFSRDEISCSAAKDVNADGYRSFSIELPVPAPTAKFTIVLNDRRTTNGMAKIDGGATSVTVPFTVGVDKDGHSAAFMLLDRGPFEALLEAGRIRIGGIGTMPLTLDMTAPADTRATMKACGTALLQALHLDPAIALAARIAPIGSKGHWLSDADFPAGGGGMVLILWTVGTDRRAHDCRVVASSGNPALPSLACRLMESRGKYDAAALDAQGKPVPSFATRPIRFGY